MRHDFPYDYTEGDLHRVIDSPLRSIKHKQVAEFELNRRHYQLKKDLAVINAKWERENGE